MYIKFDDGILDDDLPFLVTLLELLDTRLTQIQLAIETSTDPDSDGLCDRGEYLIGMGFIACQRYLASTYGPLGIRKHVALNCGPRESGGASFAEIVNATANLAKHFDEWDFPSAVFRDRTGLDANQLQTIRVIETVTNWADYTCSNVLAALVGSLEIKLTSLSPKLQAWRDELDAAHVGEQSGEPEPPITRNLH